MIVDLLITSRRDWRTEAACRSVDPELFFPSATPTYNADGEHSKPFMAQARAALAVCAGCPVRRDCLQAQLGVKRDEHAIVGGTTPGQRAMYRKQLAAMRAADAAKAAEGDAAETSPQPVSAAA